MNRDIKNMIVFWIVILLAVSPAVSISALFTWSEERLDQEWSLLLVLFLPAAGYLYWPIKSYLAYLRRTAPERRHARSLVRQADAEREAARRAQRVEVDRRRRERIHAENERRQVAQAKREVEVFYRQHASLLQETLPPSLFLANFAAAFIPGIGSSQAWEIARDLIAEMHPLLQQGRDRQREQKNRATARKKAVRAKDDEISKFERDIARLRAMGRADDGYSEDEINAIRAAIARLRNDQAELIAEEGV